MTCHDSIGAILLGSFFLPLSLVCHWLYHAILQGTCHATSRAHCCQLGWYWQASHVWMPRSLGKKWESGNSFNKNGIERPYSLYSSRIILEAHKFVGSQGRKTSVVFFQGKFPAAPVRWNLDLHRKALDKGDRDGSLRKESGKIAAFDSRREGSHFMFFVYGFVAIENYPAGSLHLWHPLKVAGKMIFLFHGVCDRFPGGYIVSTLNWEALHTQGAAACKAHLHLWISQGWGGHVMRLPWR